MANFENIIIGDSFSLLIAAAYIYDIQTTNRKLNDKDNKPSNMILSKNGYTVKELADNMDAYWIKFGTLKAEGVKNLILSIGVDDEWDADTTDKQNLIKNILRYFPNANYYITNGAYGWGKLRSTTNCNDDCWIKKIELFIGFFTSNKFKIIGGKEYKFGAASIPLYTSMPMLYEADLNKYNILQGSTTTTSTTTTTTTTAINTNGVTQQDSGRNDTNQNDIATQKNNLSSNVITKIFDPTILPSKISFNAINANQATNEMKSGFGYMPVVWYNEYQIDMEQIDFLSIYNDDIAPAIKFGFTDTLGIMRDRAFPLDDTKITVFLSSRSDQLKSIFMEFKIRNFVNSNGLMIIDGIMSADLLYVKKFKSYNSLTSNMALQDICKEIGLGFNTNIVDTNDKMTWINSGKKSYDFIEEVLTHAYISDESFLAGYVDYYYSFNYVDIQKELSRNVSEEYGIVTTNISQVLGQNVRDDIAPLILTNDFSADGSNVYFSSYRIINNATSTALSKGYSDNIRYYDVLDKSDFNFKVNSLNNDADKSIILKGLPQDETFFKSNQNFVYGGKIDSDNSHKNFKYSPTQNDRNISEAEKIMIEIQLPNPNYNVYRFQKIRLILSSSTKTPAAEMINQRLSGDWLIVDIRYIYSDKTLKQVMTLIKRELGVSDDELDKELISTNRSIPVGYDTNRGSYQNPSTSTTTETTTVATPREVTARVGGDSKITKNMTFREVTIAVIEKLEGGYFHPDMTKPNSQGIVRVKDPRYANSGETMYGLDRKAGGSAISTCPACLKFWGIIDGAGARDKWKWNFMPLDPMKTNLLNLAVQIMEPLFNSSLNKFVPEKEIRDVIMSDGRLLFNFIYAQWNGPGWFKGWANHIRDAYKNGKTKSDDLLVLFVQKRVNNTGVIGNKNNNSLIAQGGVKIAKIVGVNLA